MIDPEAGVAIRILQECDGYSLRDRIRGWLLDVGVGAVLARDLSIALEPKVQAEIETVLNTVLHALRSNQGQEEA